MNSGFVLNITAASLNFGAYGLGGSWLCLLCGGASLLFAVWCFEL